MTTDFLEDAMDSLEKFDGACILVAGQLGSTTCHRFSRIETMEEVEWIRRGVNKYLEEIEARINNT